MRKTVKEMAEETYQSPCPLCFLGDDIAFGKAEEAIKEKRKAYMVGANAVLDEIEKFAAATWGGSLTLISLKKKIKELKGQ